MVRVSFLLASGEHMAYGDSLGSAGGTTASHPGVNDN